MKNAICHLPFAIGYGNCRSVILGNRAAGVLVDRLMGVHARFGNGDLTFTNDQGCTAEDDHGLLPSQAASQSSTVKPGTRAKALSFVAKAQPAASACAAISVSRLPMGAPLFSSSARSSP